MRCGFLQRIRNCFVKSQSDLRDPCFNTINRYNNLLGVASVAANQSHFNIPSKTAFINNFIVASSVSKNSVLIIVLIENL